MQYCVPQSGVQNANNSFRDMGPWQHLVYVYRYTYDDENAKKAHAEIWCNGVRTHVSTNYNQAATAINNAFWLYDPLSGERHRKYAPGEFSEEIDICEVEGKHQSGDEGKPYLVNNATHHYVTPYCEGICNRVNVPYGKKNFLKEDISGEFHTYGFYWGKEDLIWYMDGKETYRVKHSNTSYGGFYRPLHVVLDSEIVDWHESRCRNPNIDQSLLPSVAKVDWVRHWVERKAKE